MKKFALKTGILTIALIAIAMVLDNSLEKFNLGDFSWIIPVFYFVITMFSYTLVEKAKGASQAKFFARMVGSMGLRIILCILFILIYLYTSDVTNMPVVIFFMIAYFIYTTFEIYDLVYKLRTEKFDSSNAKNP